MQFAETAGFSVFDNGAVLPPKPNDGRRIFYLILKSERDASIEVDVTNIRKENEILVGLYKLKPNSAFDTIESKLEQALRESWPDIAPYRGL